MCKLGKSPFTVERYEFNAETQEITILRDGTKSVRDLRSFQQFRAEVMKEADWKNTADAITHLLTHNSTLATLELSLMLAEEDRQEEQQDRAQAAMIYPGIAGDESALPPGVVRGSSAHARYLVWLEKEYAGAYQTMEG